MRDTLVWSFVLSVATGGCVLGDDPSSLGEESADVTIRLGVDYAWSKPSPQSLRNAGYTFAARYVSYDTTGKNITASEANALWADGVDIVSNWEWGASDALDGYARGQSDAHAAQTRAVGAGMPSSRPIYFSVDFDATPGDQTAINAYFDGVASVLGRNRTGAYGGYYPIKRLFDAGKITWGWQTYAWSGGQWDSRAQMRQVHNGVTIGGADCDVDEAHATDFGQWHYAAPPPPPPPSVDVEHVVAARNADGRLEVFWVSTNGAIYHAWQGSPGGSWSAANALGGAAKDLVVAQNLDGRLEVFYVGTNNVLYHRWQVHGGWSGEASLGVSGSDIAVGRNADGRLEVFYTTTNGGAIYHMWQTAPGSSWSAGFSLGGSAKDLAVATNADGRLEVIYVGTNSVLYHRWQVTSGWSGEASLGAGATDLAVAPNADGRLEVVFPSPSSGAIDHMWQGTPNGGWSGSAALGGAAKQMALVANKDGRLEAIYVGTNNIMYHRWQVAPGSGWSTEASLDVPVRNLAVAANADGRLEVFYATTTGALYHLWQGTGGWSSGVPLGGSVEAALTTNPAIAPLPVESAYPQD